MARGWYRNNFTKGVLDAELRDRLDLKQYGQAMLTGRNIVVMPQGGFKRLGQRRFRAKARRQLRRVPLTGLVTAPRGGTAANAVDQNEATVVLTTAGPTLNPWDFVVVTLAAAVPIAAVDLIGFKAATAAFDNAVQVQYSLDNSVWSNFGTSFNLRTTIRNRRAALPPGQTVSAQYWRVVIVGQPASGAITIGEIRLWRQTSRLSKAKEFRFAFSRDQTYTLIATDKNVDVYRDGTWQQAILIPHRSEQVEALTVLQAADTMILFHEDVAPRTLLRSGAHDEWNSTNTTFTNIPTFDSVTAFGDAQNEVQQITITGIANSHTFTVELEDIISTAITKTAPGTEATLATTIANAVSAMPNVAAAGATVVVNSLTATVLQFTITFTGATAGSRVWPGMGIDVIETDAATVTVETVQDGRTNTGPIIGSKAGYPRCGALFQGRIYVGGIKLRPSTLLGCKVNSFDFLTTGGADAGVDFLLDADEVPTILHVFAGRHLQIFTDIGEFYISDRVIDATKTPNVVLATRYGAKASAEPVSIDGATVFIQANGAVLREFVYDQGQEDYTAEALSLLASSLIRDAKRLAYRRAAETSEGNQVVIVNSDGTAALLTAMKSQEVYAFTEIFPPGGGLIRDVSIDAQRRVWFLIERTAAGVTDLYFEEQIDDSLLDASVAFAFGTGQTTIPLLDHLEGLSIGVFADGDYQGLFTVSGGQVTLPRAVTTGEAGLVPEIDVDIMPLRVTLEDGTRIDKPMRIHSARASVLRTGHLAIAGNGAAAQTVPLPRLDSIEPFTPMMSRLYSGEVVIEGLLVPHPPPREGRFRISQPVPAPLTVLSLHLEAT